MKTIISFIGIFLLASTLASAQDIENTFCSKKFEVTSNRPATASNKGFCKAGDIDYEAIVKEFGTPDEFPTLEQSRAIPFGADEKVATAVYYKDGKRDWLGFGNNVFDCFHLESNRFIVLKCAIPGGIRIGDNVSKIRASLPKTMAPEFNNWNPANNHYAYNELFNIEEPNKRSFIIYAGGKKEEGVFFVADYVYVIEAENDVIVAIDYDCSDY